MLQVYERANRLYVVTYKICQMLQSWDKLLYRVVPRLKFIVTVELLYDQVESDFFQCQTKMRVFASRICSEFKQIQLNWNRIVHQNALWSLAFSTTRPWNKQISAPDASQPSSQERWQVADLKRFKISYIFSLPRISTKDFPYIKGKIDRSIGINYSSDNFKWTQVFLCYQSFDTPGARNFSCAVSGFGQVSQRSMNFFKIQVILDKSKPTRVAMIWLRVKVNRTRLCTAVHFARNK